jgi:hypothetical protein
MTTYYKQGDALMAERIAVRAREISKVLVTEGSSKHRIQNATLRDSAYCVIEKPLRLVPKNSK